VDRVISREYGGKQKHTQDFLKKIWKRGKYNDKYIFGMIYLWTHKKSGKTYVYPGRTARREGTPFYPPYSAISVRFQEEIETAIKTDIIILERKRNQMYYDMRMVYKNAGKGQKGINAILKNFKLEIVELQLISESYKRETKIFEQLEDYWMDKAKEIGELYAAAGGSAGSHISPERSAHARKALHVKVRDLISHGFSKKEMAEYFNFPWSEVTSTSRKLDRVIKDACDGMPYTKAKIEYVGNQIFTLIDSGIRTIPELATYFKGMNSDEIFQFLASKNFPLGNLYLEGLISSTILKLEWSSLLPSQSKILSELGISSHLTYSLRDFITRRKLKSISFFKTEDLITMLKPYARIIVKHFDKASDLLKAINWYDESPMEIYLRIKELFGVNFKDAKRIYTNGFLTLDI